MVENDGKPNIDDDVQEYAFHSFDNLEADLLGKQTVDPYELKSFEDLKEETQTDFQKVIKIERTFAKEKSFEISPVVRHHRGINSQEEAEEEQRIEEEVARRVELLKNEAIEVGRKQGFDEGREQVFNETRNLVEEKMTHLSTMINEVLANKAEIMEQQKLEIFSMVKSLTKWVTLKELEGDGKYLERLLNKLIVEIQSKENLLVQVNKNDFEAMEDVLEVVSKQLGGLENIRLEIDFDIAQNGIVVESENGIINGTLETQMACIDKLFETVGVEGENEA